MVCCSISRCEAHSPRCEIDSIDLLDFQLYFCDVRLIAHDVGLIAHNLRYTVVDSLISSFIYPFLLTRTFVTTIPPRIINDKLVKSIVQPRSCLVRVDFHVFKAFFLLLSFHDFLNAFLQDSTKRNINCILLS